MQDLSACSLLRLRPATQMELAVNQASFRPALAGLAAKNSGQLCLESGMIQLRAGIRTAKKKQIRAATTQHQQPARFIC